MDKLIGTIVKKKDISGTVGIPFSTKMYTGKYKVTPSVDGETLSTANKMMSDDVTVKPIPYAEVTNLSGGLTVNIAFM